MRRPLHFIPSCVCLLVSQPVPFNPAFLLCVQPDRSASCVLPPSPSSSLPTFLSSSFSLSFLLSIPVLLLRHLFCERLCELAVLSHWEEVTSVSLTCTYLASEKRNDHGECGQHRRTTHRCSHTGPVYSTNTPP